MSAAPLLPIADFDGLVLGPERDARHGHAITVNPFGSRAKICSFNCGYCDLGVTETRLNKLKEAGALPSLSAIAESLRDALKQAHEVGPSFDAIIISGNGEPTLHPDFPALISEVRSLRDLWAKGRPIVVYTNGASLDQRKVVEALNLVDERVVKIDAGNERVFKLMNAPLARVNLAKVLSGIKSLRDLTVQSLFIQGVIDNTQANDVDDWIEVISMLKPKQVLVQGASRKTALSGIIRCDEDTLHMIASRLERRSGLRAHVSP